MDVVEEVGVEVMLDVVLVLAVRGCRAGGCAATA